MSTEYLGLGRKLRGLHLCLPGHRNVEGRLGRLWRRSSKLAGQGGRDGGIHLLSLHWNLELSWSFHHLWLLWKLQGGREGCGWDTGWRQPRRELWWWGMQAGGILHRRPCGGVILLLALLLSCELCSLRSWGHPSCKIKKESKAMISVQSSFHQVTHKDTHWTFCCSHENCYTQNGSVLGRPKVRMSTQKRKECTQLLQVSTKQNKHQITTGHLTAVAIRNTEIKWLESTMWRCVAPTRVARTCLQGLPQYWIDWGAKTCPHMGNSTSSTLPRLHGPNLGQALGFGHSLTTN